MQSPAAAPRRYCSSRRSRRRSRGARSAVIATTPRVTQPPSTWRQELGIRPDRILHGEQSFDYHRMAYAGDTLHFKTTIADIYDKKGGALEFVVRETRVANQDGEHVADLRSVLVYRNG